MLIGTIYDMQKRYDLSEQYYREALAVDPDFAPAANNLAYLLAIQDKDIDVALGYAQQAKEKLPNDPGVMDTLGWIYYKKGFYDSAISELSESVKLLPENPTVQFHLGMAYYKKGENAKAKVQLEKALSLSEEFDGADEARKTLAEL